MTDYIKDLILLDCEQGSDEWLNARKGIPTGTGIKKIITTLGKPSKSKDDYKYELLESLVIEQDFFTNAAMERGNDLEPIARSAYEFETGNDVVEVGGVYLDDKRNVMISPDGLIKGQKKGLEIKCPMPKTHIRYCTESELPSEYKLQVMSALWVTGYETWDFVSYCPEWKPQPLFILEVKREEKLISAIDKEVRAFSKTLEAHKKMIF